MAPPEEEILGDIYQGEIKSSLANATRSEFKPWHRPRKHFIRLKQWCHETRSLIRKTGISKGDEIRYLGLPGEDLLDVRVLKGVCQRAKVSLRYLGFDSALTSGEFNLSRHEINSDNYIHPSSVVVPDRIEEIVIERSPAHQYVQTHAPFDVINLDFCGCITDLSSDGIIPHLESIRSLCDIQILKQPKPWLLFLTTRAERSNLDPNVQNRLYEQLLKNIKDHSGFSDSIDSKLDLRENLLFEEVEKGGILNEPQWMNAYITAICKWLLHYMMNHEFSVSVKLLPSYVYSIYYNTKDMASLAFLFEPSPRARQDPSGLTKIREVKSPVYAEPELACRMVDEVSSIQDVDSILEADRELFNSMLEKTSDILSRLRYDKAAYRKFALGKN